MALIIRRRGVNLDRDSGLHQFVGMAMQRWIAVLLVVLTGSIALPLASAQQAQAQTPLQDQKKAQTGVAPVDLPVDLARIRRALAETPKLRFDESQRPVFRVEIFGKSPTIEEIIGSDWSTAPLPYGTLTHQEFLKMVTPSDLQGYGGLTNSEGATIAATSFLLQWTLQKAIRTYNDTQDASKREAARKEVLEALKALEEARAKVRK